MNTFLIFKNGFSSHSKPCFHQSSNFKRFWALRFLNTLFKREYWGPSILQYMDYNDSCLNYQFSQVETLNISLANKDKHKPCSKRCVLTHFWPSNLTFRSIRAIFWPHKWTFLYLLGFSKATLPLFEAIFPSIVHYQSNGLLSCLPKSVLSGENSSFKLEI